MNSMRNIITYILSRLQGTFYALEVVISVKLIDITDLLRNRFPGRVLGDNLRKSDSICLVESGIVCFYGRFLEWLMVKLK